MSGLTLQVHGNRQGRQDGRRKDAAGDEEGAQVGEERRGYAFVFIAGVIWGLIGPFMATMGACGASVELTAFLRVAFAFLFMLPITVAKFGAGSLRVDAKTLVASMALGLVCHGIYNVLYACSVELSGVATASVLLNVAPIVGLAASVLFFGEAASGVKVLAVVIDIVGCALVVTGGNFTALEFSVFGVAAGAGAGVCYAMAALIVRAAGSSANPFVISTYSYLFASAFCFVFLQAQGAPVQLNVPLLVVGAGMGLFPTAIAYVLYYYGVERIRETSRVPVIASVETVIAALFGAFVYHEGMGPVAVVGIVLVIASIALMSWRRRPPASPALRAGTRRPPQ